MHLPRLHTVRLSGNRLGIAGLALLLGGAGSELTAQLPELRLEEALSGLDSPTAVTHAGDDRLFVVQQDGQILIVENGSLLATPFLDIDPIVGSQGNEQGLFSVAFHPAYATNGRFFIDYTDTSGDTVIARYTVSGDPNRADPDSARVLLRIPQPFSNHNGGQLQFGPDGFLYVASGDGGNANDPQCRAQNGSTLLGKLLRLDVDQSPGQPPYHGIPADNPFVGGAPADEIWALGLRNPWRFSFDRETGDLFLGDVGQGAREEIDMQPASSPGGENYGWKVMEGTLCLGSTSGCAGPVPDCDAAEYTPPILEYPNGGEECAITGGYVYRGADIPELDGAYLYGDFCSGRVWAGRRNGQDWQAELLNLRLPQLTSFGEDADGEIYLLSRDGGLYRLEAERQAAPGRVELTTAAIEVGEGAGSVQLIVRRSGGSDGSIGVEYLTADDTALAGLDYETVTGTLEWEDEDDGDRTLLVPIVDDVLAEEDERFSLHLVAPTGGAGLGTASAVVTIADDDAETGPCVPGATTLCLSQGRFRVETSWRTRSGDEGLGQAELLTSDTGFFWFFRETNLEVVVKVLDACTEPLPRFWVFAAGLTNVATELVVTDTDTGAQRRYENRLDVPFQPVLDTNAFATCP